MAPTMKELLVEYAKAAKVLERGEADVCAALCEIAKAALLARAKAFVSNAQGRPLLLSYQSDSTPLLAKATYQARHSSGHVAKKKGWAGAGFIVGESLPQDRQPWRGQACHLLFP